MNITDGFDQAIEMFEQNCPDNGGEERAVRIARRLLHLIHCAQTNKNLEDYVKALVDAGNENEKERTEKQKKIIENARNKLFGSKYKTEGPNLRHLQLQIHPDKCGAQEGKYNPQKLCVQAFTLANALY